MAVVKIADVVVPAVFTEYVQLLTSQRSAFVQSGVIEQGPLFDALLAGGGRTFDMPHFKDLLDTEANVSSDDDASKAVPEKITTGQEVSIRHSRNQVWSSMDLAAALAGPDPLEAIASRVADYWVRQEQTYLISSLQGLIADNIANDAGDMVVDITAGVGAVDATNLFSAETFIDTIQTLGDVGEDLVAIAVHSTVFRRAQKNNLIDFIPDARGEVDIATFQGRRVIVDDGLPAITNGPNIEFSSYLYGAGSIVRGTGAAKVPTAVDRDELAGLGGGQEFLHSRVEWILHPRGFAWLSASMVGQSPTNAELAGVTNWDRRFERKLVKIAELRTNG